MQHPFLVHGTKENTQIQSTPFMVFHLTSNPLANNHYRCLILKVSHLLIVSMILFIDKNNLLE